MLYLCPGLRVFKHARKGEKREWIMIRNVNENFGDSVEFDSVSEMEAAILACGYDLPADGLVEGRDFEATA